MRRNKYEFYLEISFGMRNPNFNAILNKEVTFNDKSVVIPCITLIKKITHNYVVLFSLPFLDEDSLRGLLRLLLSKYRHFLDFGAFLEYTNILMGIRYAIIDTKRGSTRELTYRIELDEGKECIYAVWCDMSDSCCCGHGEGHTLEECSESEADSSEFETASQPLPSSTVRRVETLSPQRVVPTAETPE